MKPVGEENKEAVAIGKRIQAKRKILKMTSEELAAHVGVQRPSVSLWETGRCEIPLFRFLAVCDALGVTPNELLGEEILAGKTHMQAYKQGIERCMAETNYLFEMTNSLVYAALTKRFADFKETLF